VRIRSIIVVLCAVLLCVHAVTAQAPNGTISGIVLDSSGRVIVEAEVTIINDATRVQYSRRTNGEGIYILPNLPPGQYRLQVSKVGFKTLIKPDIILNVQDALAINFTLPIGAASETITVEGGAPLVNTQSASVSTVIDRNFVESLPLNGRSFNTLLQLTPGVVIAPSTFNSPGQFSVAGQRTDANNFLVDGVSANFGVAAGISAGGGSGLGQSQAFSALGATSSLVSVDALQEFRIETSSFAPEFGRTPGGQVALTTRSGTDNFHGGIFDYFRNTVMDANDWFANEAGEPRAPEQHNDFGGFFGGPLWKGKTFFFVSYEGARLVLPGTTSATVPSDYARTYATANAPALAPYLNAYPMPNPSDPVTTGVYTAQFTANYSTRATLNATSARLDHTFNKKFSIFGRYNYAPSQITALVSPSLVEPTTVNTQTMTAGVNMLISNSLSNSLRGNYSMQRSNLTGTPRATGGAVLLPASAYIGSLPSSETEYLWETFDTYYFVGGPVGRNRTKQSNFVDGLTLIEGRHEFKFGGDYRRVLLDVHPPQFQVSLEAPSVEDFLTAPTLGQVTLFATVLRPAQLLAQALSLYAQDTWKARSRVTLTYGVRWELSPAPSASGGTQLAAWTSVENPAQIALAPAGTPLWKTTYANFAPRFGLAYQLTDKGDFVLRGGAGVFYDLGTGAASVAASYFPNSANTITSGVTVPISDISSYVPPLPTLTSPPPYLGQVHGFATNLQLPRSYQWNVALEKSFGGKQAFSATYLGQAGRSLLRQEALYQPNSDFTSVFYPTLNDARSNYNALQLQYRRPLSSNMQALLNYTWSHSLDNASSDVAVGLSNTVISAASDYASSDFDVRQSFSGALSYSFPTLNTSTLLRLFSKDWSSDLVIVARNGFPFNALLYLDSSVLADQVTRADLVPGQPFWVSSSAAPGEKILNVNAFSVPTTVRQGNEARNDIPGFGLVQMDLSIGRKFPLTDRLKLQFRADAFNLLNHPNFTNPGAFVQYGSLELQSSEMLNQGLGGLNPLFQEGGSRSLQFSLKLTF
jgi:hypothetical protein